MSIRAVVAGAVVAVGLLVVPSQAATPTGRRTIELGGVPVSVTSTTAQVITVNHTVGYHARVIFWARVDGRWAKELVSTDARIGYGGLVEGDKRKQATGTTPLGTYGLISSFGTGARSTTWDLPYRRIRRHDYWVEDNRSAFYNRFRNRNLGGFRWWLDPNAVNGSERLAASPTQYRLSVVIDYNYEHPVHYRGAGIFLHVNGRGATAGCVSAPRWFLRGTMARLDPSRFPVIAIGR